MATNNRPFVCLQCGDGAKTCGNMISHIMYHHLPVKPWKCAEPNCTVTCARKDALKAHVRKAHGRGPLPAEEAYDAAIVAAVKQEAERTRVVPRAQHAPPPPGPAPAPAPRAVEPLFPPLFDPPLIAPPAAPPATPPDALEQPGYFFYYGVPYGAGPDIPGGRR